MSWHNLIFLAVIIMCNVIFVTSPNLVTISETSNTDDIAELCNDCNGNGKCVTVSDNEKKCVCDRQFTGQKCELKICHNFRDCDDYDGCDKDTKTCVCYKSALGPDCKTDYVKRVIGLCVGFGAFVLLFTLCVFIVDRILRKCCSRHRNTATNNEQLPPNQIQIVLVHDNQSGSSHENVSHSENRTPRISWRDEDAALQKPNISPLHSSTSFTVCTEGEQSSTRRSPSKSPARSTGTSEHSYGVRQRHSSTSHQGPLATMPTYGSMSEVEIEQFEHMTEEEKLAKAKRMAEREKALSEEIDWQHGRGVTRQRTRSRSSEGGKASHEKPEISKNKENPDEDNTESVNV